MPRWALLAASGSVVVAGVVLAVVALDGDEEGGAPSSTTAAATSVPSGATTTTAEGAPVQSPGAAPVSGAILSEPVEGGVGALVGDDPCAVAGGGSAPAACSRVEGSGGEFLVAVVRESSGALQARLYEEEREHTFVWTRQSAQFPPDGDVAGISLREERVSGERVIVVDYDFGGSGGVHSFDVVAWPEGEDEPRVVAFVNGTGGDRVVPSEQGLQFVGANYSDGSPTCCPTQADVRTLTRSAGGEWRITTETVPFAEAP